MIISLDLPDGARPRLQAALDQHNLTNDATLSLDQFLTRTILELAVMNDMTLRLNALQQEVTEYQERRTKEELERLIDTLSVGP